MENQQIGLMEMLEAMWCQKQLDDLFLAEQSLRQQIKNSPGNIKVLSNIEKVKQDIAILTPVVRVTGMKVAAYIENKFDIRFVFFATGNGKTTETPHATTNDKKLSNITLPETFGK